MRFLIPFFFLLIAFAATNEENKSSELVIMRGGNMSDKDFDYPDVDYFIRQFEKIANTCITKSHVIYRLVDKDEVENVLVKIPDAEHIERHELPPPHIMHKYWSIVKNISRDPFINQELPPHIINLQPETTNLFFVIVAHGSGKSRGKIAKPDISGEDFADFIREIFENNKSLKKMILVNTSCLSHLISQNIFQAFDENLKNKVIILSTTSPEKPTFCRDYNYVFNLKVPPHQLYTFLNKEIFWSYEWPDHIKSTTTTYNFLNMNNWNFSDLLKNNHEPFADPDPHHIGKNKMSDEEGNLCPDKLSIHGHDFDIKSPEFNYIPTTLRIRYYFQERLLIDNTRENYDGLEYKIKIYFPKFTEISKILKYSKLQVKGIDGVDESSQKAIFQILGYCQSFKTKGANIKKFHRELKREELENQSLFEKNGKEFAAFFSPDPPQKTMRANWYLDITYDLNENYLLPDHDKENAVHNKLLGVIKQGFLLTLAYMYNSKHVFTLFLLFWLYWNPVEIDILLFYWSTLKVLKTKKKD